MIDFLSSNWLWIIAAVSIAVVAVLVSVITKNRRIFEDILKKTETKKDDEMTVVKKDTVVTSLSRPSLSAEDVERLKSELRVMDVEKEIVSYALTRLYEAEAEGKLSDKDRELLLEKYKDSMQHLDKEIEKKQMIVKLNDLEKTKTDLIEMFNTKLEEISKNIDNIRVTLGIQPLETIKEKPPAPQAVEIQPTKERKEEESKTAAPKPRPKSKAEEKIEAIQEEVLKVLERLEQIETEK